MRRPSRKDVAHVREGDMPVARGNGADLYYEVRGSGPPVVFISGAFSDVARH